MPARTSVTESSKPSLMFEEIVRKGFLVFDPQRKVLTFNREVISKFPALRKTKMDEFKWLVGKWAAQNRVRATPTTPAYEDTYRYTFELRDDGTRIYIAGPDAKFRPYLTWDPFSKRWMMTLIEGGFGVLQSSGWAGDSIVFTGRVTMLGADCDLRHTITKISDVDLYAVNEQQLPNGEWIMVDDFIWRRE